MIDIDKYEGHTPGPWLYGSGPDDPEFFTIVSDWEESVYCRVATVSTRWSAPMNEANARLIRAAPDLLAEVKRLRSTIEILAADYDSLILDLGRASTLDLDIEEVYEKHLMGVNDE